MLRIKEVMIVVLCLFLNSVSANNSIDFDENKCAKVYFDSLKGSSNKKIAYKALKSIEYFKALEAEGQYRNRVIEKNALLKSQTASSTEDWEYVYYNSIHNKELKIKAKKELEKRFYFRDKEEEIAEKYYNATTEKEYVDVWQLSSSDSIYRKKSRTKLEETGFFYELDKFSEESHYEASKLVRYCKI
jgi:hypothetical protein